MNLFGESLTKKSVFTTSVTTGAQLYRESKEVIEYYDSQKIAEAQRVILAGVLVHAADNSLDAKDTLSWFFTLTDCFFPGLISKVLTSTQTVVLKQTSLTSQEIAYLESPSGSGALKLFPTATKDPQYLLSATDTLLLGVYLSLLFSIGKSATDQNLTAFTVNRPKAFLGRQNITEVPLILQQASMPTLLAYQSINGAFNMYLEVRKLFVSELVRWTTTSISSPRISLVATVVRLWETSGMTHIQLIYNMMIGYGDILLRLKSLHAEIHRFMSEYNQACSTPDCGLSYFKALEGDKRSILFSRNFPELLKLARELAARQDSRFRQYAAAMTMSAYWDAFEAAANESGIPIPGSGAPANPQPEG